MEILVELEDGRTFVFSRPTRAIYFRFLDTSTESFAGALYNLLLDCAKEPDPNTLAGMIENEPALLGVLGGELVKHMGGVAVKKSVKRESG